MSAIPASSVSLKTMADGTLRISFDIEPIHAQDALGYLQHRERRPQLLR